MTLIRLPETPSDIRTDCTAAARRGAKRELIASPPSVEVLPISVIGSVPRLRADASLLNVDRAAAGSRKLAFPSLKPTEPSLLSTVVPQVLKIGGAGSSTVLTAGRPAISGLVLGVVFTVTHAPPAATIAFHWAATFSRSGWSRAACGAAV